MKKYTYNYFSDCLFLYQKTKGQPIRFGFLFLIILLFSGINLNAQTLLAGWDFQTISNGGTAVMTAPNTPLVCQANFGTGTLYADGTNGSSTFVTATSGNQINAFGGTSVNAGAGFSTLTTSPASMAIANNTANGKAVVFAFNMSGHANLIVSYATQRSGTGFTSQQWDYSTDGITWTSAQTITSIPLTFGITSLNTITALDNASAAYLRLTFNGATGSGGNNRLDNIQFNATLVSMPPVVMNDTAIAMVGLPFSRFISASNSPTSYNAISLPAGLSVNTITGEISGTPTNVIAASAMPISATNNGGTGNAILYLQINQGAQTITFPGIPTKVFGDASFTLNGTGGNSGNPLSFISANTNVATISGNIVTIVGAGSSLITASQTGNTDYLAAADVSQMLTVNQASQNITFNPLPTKLINDAPFSLMATGGASNNPITYASDNTSVATISGNVVTIVGPGTSNITASQMGNANYLAANDTTQPLVVDLLPQTITFNGLPSKLISDPPFTINATGGASGNNIFFSSSNTAVATIIGNTVTIVGAGVTTITATQAGNSIYAAASPIQQNLVVNAASSIAMFTFGGSATPTASATSGLPIANLVVADISQGNNANTTQTSINLTTTSASNNAGSSGAMNAGITARNRNFEVDSSAFFECTFSPSTGNTVTLNAINFNTRSTGTGPTTLDIRSSLDNYQSAIATLTVLNNSTWTAQAPIITPISSTSPLNIRIYGYVVGGSGSISTGAFANNWRVDDVAFDLSTTTSYPCSLSVAATATNINCNGGSSIVTVTPTNENGLVQYKINSSAFQTSNTFSGVVAGIYTITAKDAYLCEATTTLVITEPNATLVSAYNVSGCNGIPIQLTGLPLGGTFSVANPYNGLSTTFTYTYVDSNGCSSISQPANITVNDCAILNLKLFLQSYYIGAGNMLPVLYNQGVSNDQSIVDDILVELRNPSSYALVASTSASLHTNGTMTCAFPNISGYYYVVVRHRNCLPTWNAFPIQLGSIPISYDFSTDGCMSYECHSAELEPGIFGIYSGDLVYDKNIDLLDLPVIETDLEAFAFGYYASDMNGDGNVDLLDIPVVEGNIANFIFAYQPELIEFPETMEDGVKTSYTTADVTLSTGLWNFDDALLGTSTSDRKNGAKSARIQNVGKITMNFNVFVDSSLVTVMHAKYASEANSTWALYKSTNNGVTWVQEGITITTSSTSLQNVTFVITNTGNTRFQIRKLSGGRLNIDDFAVIANTGSTATNDNDHIAMGNPSNALTDITFPDNYLVVKPQYDYAYDNSRGIAAWVAWHLELSDVGNTPRCDCFATDVQLPSSFFRANSSNYTGSGFDRGHQVPSSHRNNNITNNAATFLMGNIMPQAPNLNQVTWNNLEQYCTTLINSGYELYTYSGGYGVGGTGSNGGVTNTIASGNITVPSNYWKVIVVLPVGNNDINRVSNTTRVIAVDMPNTQTVSANSWGYYRTSIDAIETATGFDFLTNIANTIQTTIEAIVDNGPTN